MQKEQGKTVKILSTIIALFVILYSVAVGVLVPAACVKFLFFN